MGNTHDKVAAERKASTNKNNKNNLKHCQSYTEIDSSKADELKRRKSVGSKKFSSTKDVSAHNVDSKYNDYKPVKREDPLITPAQRDIIESSWEQGSTGSIGNRIYLRVFEKRPDLQYLFDAMGRDKWEDEGKQFTIFLAEIVGMLAKMDQITAMCMDWGQRHVELKAYGFKPDFWVTMADAMTTECLYLDAGAHPPADVIGSWATLISQMFGSMRDGYYDRLRKQRRQSQKLRRQSTMQSQSNSEGGNEQQQQQQQQQQQPISQLSLDTSDTSSRGLSVSPNRAEVRERRGSGRAHSPGRTLTPSPHIAVFGLPHQQSTGSEPGSDPGDPIQQQYAGHVVVQQKVMFDDTQNIREVELNENRKTDYMSMSIAF